MKIRKTFKSTRVVAADAQDLRARYQQRRENSRAKKAALKQELVNQIAECKNADDPIQALFDLLVPVSGPSKYYGGELIRAMMRLLYRDMNDGDVFYTGYGIETCADAVAFLCGELPYLKDEFEDIAMRKLEDSQYTRELNAIADSVVNEVVSDPEAAAEPTTLDYLQSDGADFIRDNEWEPTYDIDLDIPSNVIAHIDRGDISENDVAWEIESWLQTSASPDISVGSFYVSISDLSYEDYEELSDGGDRWFEEYGDSLDDEYGDPEDDEDDEDEEEE